MAGQIAKDITQTTHKLQKLAQCELLRGQNFTGFLSASRPVGRLRVYDLASARTLAMATARIELVPVHKGDHFTAVRNRCSRPPAAEGRRQHNANIPVAKRKTLFDDRPMEISELTYIIKQDMSHLNSQIGDLATYTKTHHDARGKAVEQHNSNVVTLLQSRVKEMAMGFQDVLELRTQNMKASRDRTEQFMHTTSAAAVPAPAKGELPSTTDIANITDSLLFAPAGGPGSGLKGKTRATPDGGADFLALNIDEPQQTQDYQQMQLMEQQDDFIQSRSNAIETIESTISELGGMFSQLASLVQMQRERIDTIDQNVHDVDMNINAAHGQLLKYYESISSNRWLMLKIFGVLIIFVS